MRWNRIRAEMQMPYPLDHETAAAIEAAMQRHVLTWEVLEERDDMGQWLRDSLVAEGGNPPGLATMVFTAPVHWSTLLRTYHLG